MKRKRRAGKELVKVEVEVKVKVKVKVKEELDENFSTGGKRKGGASAGLKVRVFRAPHRRNSIQFHTAL